MLGDAATDEVIAAWGEAYGLLADILIEREAEIYARAAQRRRRVERVSAVRRASARCARATIVTSFYLGPPDGGALADVQAGQYITVQIDHPTTPTSPRNYSLSDRPGRGTTASA